MPPHVEPRMGELRLSIIGAMLTAIGPMSMYLYAPAVGAVAAELQATDAAVKLTLSAFFGGFAISQLVVGPVSDAIGRKTAINVFLGGFCIATMTGYLAASVETLMAARFVQGIGAAAGMAVSRALVRDLFAGLVAARTFALMSMMLAIAPAVSPVVGGLVTTAFGWRAVFLLMIAFGVATIAASALFVVETVRRDWSRIWPSQWLVSYRIVLASRSYVTSAAAVALLVAVVYANNALLPFVLMDVVGLSPLQFGVAFLAHPLGFLVGSMVARQVLSRHSADFSMLCGYCVLAVACAGMLCLLAWTPTAWRVLVPVGLFSCGVAFIMPALTAAALERFPHVAGAASSMLGFAQMTLGLLASVAGSMVSNTVVAVALLMPVMAALSAVAFGCHRSLSKVSPH